MDSSPTPVRKTSKMKKYIVISAGLLVLLAIAAGTTWLIRQPSLTDFEQTRDSLLPEVARTQDELAPRLNDYLEAFKKHQNETGSIDKAKEQSKVEFNAFKQAETKAREALNRLESSKAQNDSSAGPVIGQLVDIYEEQTDFYAGLVSGYPDAQRLFFGDNNTVCKDILIGNKSDNISHREAQLEDAVGDCLKMINTIKKAKNPPYDDFAMKVERRIGQMQESVKVVAKAERDQARFTAEKDRLVKEVAEAQIRNASDAEYQVLFNKVKALDREIRQSTARIDSSRESYINAVKSLPGLYEAVYKTEVPTKLKFFAAISDIRLKTLEITIESKLSEA